MAQSRASRPWSFLTAPCMLLTGGTISAVRDSRWNVRCLIKASQSDDQASAKRRTHCRYFVNGPHAVLPSLPCCQSCVRARSVSYVHSSPHPYCPRSASTGLLAIATQALRLLCNTLLVPDTYCAFSHYNALTPCRSAALPPCRPAALHSPPPKHILRTCLLACLDRRTLFR
ncbi:hypothetical protein MPH_10553 [Macrophomina phaseolina MS6]|uniref:Secreted protein n=1 Tax=Macrophomina phaseolina (strain MS6) TaxID=1126212 RepID=K2QRB2_MACPH|nr:hypothetical protein MPH_10553 [Macrophomina phaseolina MS6]